MRYFREAPATAFRRGLCALYPRLWRYCLVVCGTRDKADDLAQAACLRALERAAQFQPGSNLDRWVFKLTQRLWIDELRAQTVRAGGGLVAVEDAGLVDPHPDPETNAQMHNWVSSVMKLPEAQRVTVLLVYVEGYSYKETAGILDIPIGTVMSRISNARRKLIEQYENFSEVV